VEVKKVVCSSQMKQRLHYGIVGKVLQVLLVKRTVLLIICITPKACMVVFVCMCRESGESGNVFGVLFNANPSDREHFALSRCVVGGSVLVVKSQLEGRCCNMPVVWSPDPCLECGTKWSPFVPKQARN
jgi:hypothetical protein